MVIRVSVPSYRTIAEDGPGRSYTVFVIEVYHLGRVHRIEKRYRAFHSLHKQLKKEVNTPEFPPKRVRNWNSRVLEHRRQGLEYYLQAILAFNPIPKSAVAFLDIHGLLCEIEDEKQSLLSAIGSTNSVAATTHQPIVTFISDPVCLQKNRVGLNDMVVKGVLAGLYGVDLACCRASESPWFKFCLAFNGWAWRQRRRLHGSADINARKAREMFLDYFVKAKGHTYVRPSSVVAPDDDPSLLFTNAGMNQFKSILLGDLNDRNGNRVLSTAANSQKCVRVGGKHNDLDDVGRDGHHHTFFEMLGSWSFGHYFKAEACRMAWELLTGPFQIPARRLYVTYYGGDSALGLEPDNECRDVWLRIGLPPDRLLPFGAKDNFWEMGNTGPCGPCTEIHYSHVDVNDVTAVARLVNTGRPEVIELWNLVFVQYNRLADGSLSKLARFHVDTGMGLERLAAVLCGSTSNYDTDLFCPLFSVIHKRSGCRPYEGRFATDDHEGVDTAYRIVADHARMCAVVVADGVVPDEYGAGHCLRRVIRRAVAASRMNLHAPTGMFAELLPHVAASLGDTFPEVNANLVKSVEVVHEEEDKFLTLLGKGLNLFKRMCVEQKLRDVFSAENMWSLFFIHGLPEDLISDMCVSRGLTPDLKGFKCRLLEEKAKSAQAFWSYRLRNQSEIQFIFSQKATEHLRDMDISPTDDTFKYAANFYNNVLSVPSLESHVIAIWDGEKFVNEIVSSHRTFGVILNQTNFYSEAGGQVSDEGFIKSQNAIFKVDNVQALKGYIVHQGTLLEGRLPVGADAILNVDEVKRAGCTRNHTATHLLQAALRNVLGSETAQKSSVVAQDYLRFDFSVKAPLKRDQFERIESLVCRAIKEKLSVRRLHLSSSEAFNLSNLIKLPNASYPDQLTVVVVNPTGDFESPLSEAISLEPCCGTHVTNTEALLDFVILSQRGLSQVSRSIRAVTGAEAAKAKQLGQRIESDVDKLEVVVSNIECGIDDNFDVYHELSAIRTMAAEDDIPLVWRNKLDLRIAGLKQRLTRVIRKRSRSELEEILTQSPNSEYLLHVFEVGGSNSIVFSEVGKVAPKLPSCVFVASAGQMHCQLRVPNELSTDDFNSRRWADAVVSVLGGSVTKPVTENAKIVSQVHGGDIRKAELALEAALEFVRNHLGRSSQ